VDLDQPRRGLRPGGRGHGNLPVAAQARARFGESYLALGGRRQQWPGAGGGLMSRVCTFIATWSIDSFIAFKLHARTHHFFLDFPLQIFYECFLCGAALLFQGLLDKECRDLRLCDDHQAFYF
jgi:hypothetical protein